MAISNVMSESLISAGNAMKMAEIRQGLNKKLENKAGVLSAEIKLDGGRGTDTGKKKEELEKTEEKASKISAKSIEALSDMNNDLRSAVKKELEERRAEKKKTEKAAEKKRIEKEEQKRRPEKASDKTEEEAGRNEGAQEIGSVNIVADVIMPETGVVESVGTKVDVKT